MLVNISYNQPKIREKIIDEVGSPFTLVKRFQMKGIGSPKLYITETSIDIHNIRVLDRNAQSCNIEMRPKGILVIFRSLLDTYALVIPYYKLYLYKGKSFEYSIHRDHSFIKVKGDTPQIHNFMKKILDYKVDNAPTGIEDLRNDLGA